MTEEAKYATVDELRKVLEMVGLLQTQITLIHTSLQAQVNILCAKTIEEVREATKKGREENIGLEGLHKMARGEDQLG